MAEKPKPRTTKRRFQHVSNPFNECFFKGTVFGPDWGNTSDGGHWWRCNFAIYAGKDRESGEYLPSHYISLAMFGPAAEAAIRDLPEKARASIYCQVRVQKYQGTYRTSFIADWFEVDSR